MATHRGKARDVDAWDFVMDGDAPDWVMAAIKAQQIRTDQAGGTWFMVVGTAKGPAIAELDDWIVRDTDGALSVWKPAAFRAAFERIAP